MIPKIPSVHRVSRLKRMDAKEKSGKAPLANNLCAAEMSPIMAARTGEECAFLRQCAIFRG